MSFVAFKPVRKAPLVSTPPAGTIRNLTPTELRLQAILRRVMQRMEEGFDPGVAMAGISSGDLAGIAAAFPWDQLPYWLQPAEDFMRAEYVAGGGVASRALRIRFDLMNPRAVAWAANRSSQLVVEITDTARLAIQEAIHQATMGQQDVWATARYLKNIVGLNSRLAGAVTRYRMGLEAAGATNIDALVARKANQLLNYRTQLIARTEIVNAGNQGRIESWRQAQEQGLLPPQAGKRWVAAEDERTCPVCADLDGQVVGMEEQFQTIDGDLVDAPGAHPGCRCSLAAVPDGVSQEDTPDEPSAPEEPVAMPEDVPAEVPVGVGEPLDTGPIEFTGDAPAEAWADETRNDWIATALAATGIDPLYDAYVAVATDVQRAVLNEALRGAVGIEERLARTDLEWGERIDRASKVREVWDNLSSGEGFELPVDAAAWRLASGLQLIPGDVFVDPGFVAGLLSPKALRRLGPGTPVRLTIPAGTRVMLGPARAEMILPSDSMFRVVEGRSGVIEAVYIGPARANRGAVAAAAVPTLRSLYVWSPGDVEVRRA